MNREIAHPKQRNLQKAGTVIFIYSLTFTSLVSFFAVMLIPDADREVRQGANDNPPMRLSRRTAIRGGGRVDPGRCGEHRHHWIEWGLKPHRGRRRSPNWLRRPHSKYGTTNRMINMVVALQVLTVLLSRGNIMLLGEAYAFGVVWSFAMKSLSVLVLRFKMPEGREWRVPFNLHIKGIEIPVGLGLVTLFLFVLAIVNVATKEVATTAGVAFTLVFFTIFQVTETINRRRNPKSHGNSFARGVPAGSNEDVSAETLAVRPGSVLVAVRNPNRLTHLRRVLQKTDTSKLDVVVVSVRRITGEHMWTTDQLFADRETEVFSHVVSLAEKEGEHVKLLVVPGRDPVGRWSRRPRDWAVRASFLGTSPRQSIAEQGIEVGAAWEKLAEPRPALSLEVVPDDGSKPVFVNLGPHPPRLWPQDIALLHQLWLELSESGPRYRLHHRDVVGWPYSACRWIYTATIVNGY